jgi:nucleotide-binding universal stress UspA family protein
MSRTLLVSYEGSPASRWALQWAAVEALRLQARLEVVAVADHQPLAGCPATQLLRGWRALHARADALAVDAARLVTAVAPALHVDVHAEVGAPAAALVTASRRGSALVLGTGGRPGRRARRRDLVVEAVVAHARCPVVVVRRGHVVHAGPTTPVVVGIDGSSRSQRALDVAAAVASASGAPLHVVCVWSPRASASLRHGMGGWGSAGEVIVDEDTARHVAESGAARARQAYSGVRSRAVVRAGHPPAVLLRLARGGGLLVLGRRGRGERSSLLLGSVSRTALGKPPCPVALVGLVGSPPEPITTAVARPSDLSLRP